LTKNPQNHPLAVEKKHNFNGYRFYLPAGTMTTRGVALAETLPEIMNAVPGREIAAPVLFHRSINAYPVVTFCTGKSADYKPR
jgi:hypothetical protein